MQLRVRNDSFPVNHLWRARARSDTGIGTTLLASYPEQIKQADAKDAATENTLTNRSRCVFAIVYAKARKALSQRGLYP